MMMEPSNQTFKLFHRYHKLVRRGLVKPLECSYCDTPLVTGMGEDDELVLKCISCDSATVPGLSTIDRVRAVVTEHFVEDEDE